MFYIKHTRIKILQTDQNHKQIIDIYAKNNKNNWKYIYISAHD